MNSAPNKTQKLKSASLALKEKWPSVQTHLYSINWKERMWGIWGFLLTSGIVYVTGDNIYVWWVKHSNERRVNKTLEKGTQPQKEVSEDKLISRPEIVERLKVIFEPNEDHSYYHLVCGEHGTGKTTLTTEVAREVGKGVIYVDTPADIEEFGKSFGTALNLKFEEDASITAKLRLKFFGDITDLKWKRALKAFKGASEVYKAKHGKPPVIIYDNISRIVHKNPEIIDILQGDAKDYADKRGYIAVFVCSEGLVPRRMESHSAWSRADKPVMEIGDLSKKESIDYLVDMRKVKKEEAERLYELVGGRIVYLKSMADKSLARQTFEDIKKQILSEVEKKFKTAQLLPKQLYHEVGKKAIRALLDSKELRFRIFMEFFDNYEEAGKVLETNVFAYHPETNTVTFQSKSIECYIRENADIFIK